MPHYLKKLFDVPSAEALREMLDELNDSGAQARVAGIDAAGEPFVAYLPGDDERAWAVMLNAGHPGYVGNLTVLAYPVVIVR